jgi:hypothetical protein
MLLVTTVAPVTDAAASAVYASASITGAWVLATCLVIAQREFVLLNSPGLILLTV